MRFEKRYLLIYFLVAMGCVQTPPKDSRPLHAIAAENLRNYKAYSSERECVRSSLQTLLAIQSFNNAQLGDEKIKSLMLDKLTNPAILEMRTADYDTWHKSHSLPVLAERHLEYCLRHSGSQLQQPNRLQYCFHQTEPAALISNYRQTGRSLPVAIEDATSKYPDVSRKIKFYDLGRRIYLLATDEDGFDLRESILFDCLKDSVR